MSKYVSENRGNLNFKAQSPLQCVWGIFKKNIQPSTNLILCLFNDHSEFWFSSSSSSLSSNDPMYLNTFITAWVVYFTLFETAILWSSCWYSFVTYHMNFTRNTCFISYSHFHFDTWSNMINTVTSAWNYNQWAHNT